MRLTVIAGAQQDRIARIPLAEVFTPQLAVARLPITDLPAEVLQYKEDLFESRQDEDTEPSAVALDDVEEGATLDELADDLPELSLDVLGRERTQVILGTPGSGKSTLLECAALSLCEPPGRRDSGLPLSSLADRSHSHVLRPRH